MGRLLYTGRFALFVVGRSLWDDSRGRCGTTVVVGRSISVVLVALCRSRCGSVAVGRCGSVAVGRSLCVGRVAVGRYVSVVSLSVAVGRCRSLSVTVSWSLWVSLYVNVNQLLCLRENIS